MADEPTNDPSSRSGDGGRHALLLAAAGVGMGILLLAGMFWTNMGFVAAAALFLSIPVIELAALIVALTTGRGSVMGSLAAIAAVACLGGWGYVLYRLLTMPLIRLF